MTDSARQIPEEAVKWSCGHQFIVRGGGHIDTWQPLSGVDFRIEAFSGPMTYTSCIVSVW